MIHRQYPHHDSWQMKTNKKESQERKSNKEN